MECPCNKCLKFAICVGKQTIICEELYKWLLNDDKEGTISHRVIKFEYETGRELRSIYDNEIKFKPEPDHYACFIPGGYQ